METRQIMYPIVKVITDGLTDAQLAGVNLTLALKNDPRKLPQWETASPLFTEKDENGFPAMHRETRTIFNIIVRRRLDSSVDGA